MVDAVQAKPGAVEWIDRAPESDANSYESQIDEANRASADLRIHLPIRASDDYVRQCAQLMRSRLRGRLVVELGDRIYDGRYADFAIVNDLGLADSAIAAPNRYYAGPVWHLRRSLQLFAVVQDVYGEQAMGSKALRALAVGGNVDCQSFALQMALHSDVHNPQRQRIDVIYNDTALAAHYGARSDV